ncbi:MAG TPA: DUF3347 domain-containing protein, partial [Bacteroidetes bacterium]|nr:DUF3347 domain-containing protein [Bacteroidota bacterium]
VPKSAVLWTGKRAVVYVKLPNREHNSFIYREVILGEDAGNFYIVKKGLEAGEEIASNGVFKIDASAQLAGKKSMINPTGGKVATGHNHGGGAAGDGKKMDMSKMDMPPEIKVDKSKVPGAFQEQLGRVVTRYLSLKDDLVDDNPEIHAHVQAMQKALKQVDMSLVLEDAHNVWMKALKGLNNDLKQLGQEVNLEAQRKLFLTLSKTLADVTQKLGVKMESGQTLYLEYCPMADNNKGGFWLGTEKKIRNPYFGQAMSTCGEVKGEIK